MDGKEYPEQQQREEVVYKDEHTGHILFGQAMLDRHTSTLSKVYRALKYAVILGYLLFAFIIFLFWYVVHHNVLNNIVARCL